MDSEVNSDVLKAAQKFTLGNEKDADVTAIINNEPGPSSAVTTTNPSETVKKNYWMITGKDYKYTTWITFKDDKGQHLDANSTVKIVYSNLNNSSYDGIKIKKLFILLATLYWILTLRLVIWRFIVTHILDSGIEELRTSVFQFNILQMMR